MARFITRLHMSRSASMEPPNWLALTKIIRLMKNWKQSCHLLTLRRSASLRMRSLWCWSRRRMQLWLLSCLVNLKSLHSSNCQKLSTTATVITMYSINSWCRTQRSLMLISSLLTVTVIHSPLPITTTVCILARQDSWQPHPSSMKMRKEMRKEKEERPRKSSRRPLCQLNSNSRTNETPWTHHNAVKVMILAQTWEKPKANSEEMPRLKHN